METTDELAGALAGTIFAGKLRHFAEIDSTNLQAMREAAAGAEHGTVYIADAQSAGRGRGAHTWHSSPGAGLYCSLLLRPPSTLSAANGCQFSCGLQAQGDEQILWRSGSGRGVQAVFEHQQILL